MSKFSGVCLAAVAVLGMAFGGAARSGPGDTPAFDAPAAPRVGASTPEATPAPGLMGLDPVRADALAGARGGTAVSNEMLSQGYVSDNQAVNVTTGSNFISDGSFSNAGGVPMVVQNTGNNVLIQNSTILNLQVQ